MLTSESRLAVDAVVAVEAWESFEPLRLRSLALRVGRVKEKGVEKRVGIRYVGKSFGCGDFFVVVEVVVVTEIGFVAEDAMTGDSDGDKVARCSR